MNGIGVYEKHCEASKGHRYMGIMWTDIAEEDCFSGKGRLQSSVLAFWVMRALVRVIPMIKMESASLDGCQACGA